jgi:glyoxylase I family protein
MSCIFAGMQPNPLQLRGVDHVALRVRSLDRSIAFYCSVLRCEVAARNEDAGIVHLRAGAQMIDLIWLEGRMGKSGGAEPRVEARNMHHICLAYEPHDSDALFAYLDAQKIEHSAKPQDNLGAGGQGTSVYLADPDENLIEVKFYGAIANSLRA